MTSKAFQIRSYFSYWLDAVDEHSLHSPFFFDFYSAVVKGVKKDYRPAEILREKLLHDKRFISVNDLGSKNIIQNRRVSEIAKSSLSQSKFSSLYSRIINKYNHKNIIELGTSLGINTLYLAAEKNASVTTFEGSDEIAGIAELTFEFAGALNINLVKGNINNTLPASLLIIRKVDFAFIDANHTYGATLRYFELLLPKIHEHSVIVIDDIHYSAAMEKAWNEIKANDLVYSSVDLYRCGILFFDPSLNKQNVILQF